MTEKRDMKWALELAIETFQKLEIVWKNNLEERETYRQAADMLRNGGPVKEKRSKATCYKCECGKLYKRQSYCPECTMSAYPHSTTITAKKRWTECEKIQIITEKSEPAFEEIK